MARRRLSRPPVSLPCRDDDDEDATEQYRVSLWLSHGLITKHAADRHRRRAAAARPDQIKTQRSNLVVINEGTCSF